MHDHVEYVAVVLRQGEVDEFNVEARLGVLGPLLGVGCPHLAGPLAHHYDDGDHDVW